MTPGLLSWAQLYGITPEALQALQQTLVWETMPTTPGVTLGSSESAVQQAVRFGHAARGDLMWRNNVGACVDDRGNHIRYGLCNDSKKLNDKIKSHDLIGIRKVLITPEMVGRHIGQFLSRECKAQGWKYRGSEREQAQAAFATLVNQLGGDAKFTTGAIE